MNAYSGIEIKMLNVLIFINLIQTKVFGLN